MGIVQISLKSNRICLRYNDLSDRRIRSCARPQDGSQTDPTMEQAFITLINRWDKENSHEQ